MPRQTAHNSGGRPEGLCISEVTSGAVSELCITANPAPWETFASVCDQIAAVLEHRQAQVLKIMGFGKTSAYTAILSYIEKAIGPVRWPITWVDGTHPSAEPIRAVQVWAVAGAEVHTLWLDGLPVGRLYNSGGVHHCIIGGTAEPESMYVPEHGAQKCLQRATEALALAGMNWSDVVRTWFFLSDMLNWYPAFNTVRSRFYQQHGLDGQHLPASTGVGAVNPLRASVVLDILAVRPNGTPVRIAPVASPQQCPAPAYGSAFSRAVEVQTAGIRRLYISGTASIDLQGTSVHEGNLNTQIDLTGRVLQALLESRGMCFANVIRAVAYLKHFEHRPVFERWRRQYLPHPLPVSVVQSDICRPELSFEMEMDAVAADGSDTAVCIDEVSV